jgi:hypothetical protein
MLRGKFAAAGDVDADALRAAYDDELATVLDAVGIETATEETGIDRETLDALTEGRSPDISLTDAAAILALDENHPDAESIAAEARDILLMGMTTAVLDVEALASEVDDALEPKEIQQKIEGRFPMSLDEYALIHTAIEARSR